MEALYGRAIERNRVGEYKQSRDDLERRWELALQNEWKGKRPSLCDPFPLFSTNFGEFPAYLDTQPLFNPSSPVLLQLINPNLPSPSPSPLLLTDKPLFLFTFRNSTVFGITQQVLVGGCSILLTDSPLFYPLLNSFTFSALSKPPRSIELQKAQETSCSSRASDDPLPPPQYYSTLLLPYADSTLNNYYHLITDSLPKLLFFLKYMEESNTQENVILLPAEKYTQQLISILKLKKEQYVIMGPQEHVHAQNVKALHWLNPFSQEEGEARVGMNYSPSYLIEILRNHFVKEEEFERKYVIYLGRSNTKTRAVLHQHLLIDALSNEFGEEFISYEESTTNTGNTITEQIRLFQKAKVVVGPHGAGLTNIVWTPPGTPLIEFPVIDHKLDHFKFLAGVLHRDYWIVDDVSASYEGTYELNAKNVHSVLSTVRASLSSLPPKRDEL